MIREFKLSSPGRGRNVSCDANGAFVGAIPLLKRSGMDGKDRWEPCDCGDLSKQLGKEFGLPIDISSKIGGLKAISNALNDGDIALAQIATVLLGIPDPPPLVKGTRARSELIKFIRDLDWSGLIKADWDSDEHPRWPSGAPNSQGGQFAPKGNADASAQAPGLNASRIETADDNTLRPTSANGGNLLSVKEKRRSAEECEKILDSDMYICGSLRDKEERAICRSSAMQRYSNCLRGKPMPPLALPDPENNFQPLPNPRAPKKTLPTPPWWMFLPRLIPEIPIPA